MPFQILERCQLRDATEEEFLTWARAMGLQTSLKSDPSSRVIGLLVSGLNDLADRCQRSKHAWHNYDTFQQCDSCLKTRPYQPGTACCVL